jgi:predicted  nucleic acid-binding Zn-ribbon protein
MQWFEWVPIVLGIIGITTAILAAIRFFIKYHVKESMEDIRHELKPNGGSSMKDQITRLEEKQGNLEKKVDANQEKVEQKIDKIYDTLLSYVTKRNQEIEEKKNA